MESHGRAGNSMKIPQIPVKCLNYKIILLSLMHSSTVIMGLCKIQLCPNSYSEVATATLHSLKLEFPGLCYLKLGRSDLEHYLNNIFFNALIVKMCWLS